VRTSWSISSLRRAGGSGAVAQNPRANVLPAPQQVAGGVFLLGGDVNRGECPGPVEDGELGRIAAIGFDAVAGSSGNERRGDHVTGDAVGRQPTLELEASWPGFVAALHGRRSLQALDEPPDRRQIRRQRMQRRRALAGNNTAATVVAAW
jgi:hypothetical protein